MGDAMNDDLRINFDIRLRVKFLGSKVTTDAGLLAYREIDETLGLTGMGLEMLTDSRLGSNKQHGLVHCCGSQSTADWPVMKTSMTPSVCALTLPCGMWWAVGQASQRNKPPRLARSAGLRQRYSALRTT